MISFTSITSILKCNWRVGHEKFTWLPFVYLHWVKKMQYLKRSSHQSYQSLPLSCLPSFQNNILQFHQTSTFTNSTWFVLNATDFPPNLLFLSHLRLRYIKPLTVCVVPATATTTTTMTTATVKLLLLPILLQLLLKEHCTNVTYRAQCTNNGESSCKNSSIMFSEAMEDLCQMWEITLMMSLGLSQLGLGEYTFFREAGKVVV